MKKTAFIQLSRATWKQNGFKKIVSNGPETALAALYIISAPNGNMTGVYEMTKFDLQRHTGISDSQANESLRHLCDIGFCEYDHDEQYIWEKGAIQRHLGKCASPQQLKGIINNFVRLQEEDAPFVQSAFELFTKNYPGSEKFVETFIEKQSYNSS